MSYGHADNLASGGEQQTPPAERPPQTPKADPPGALPPDWYTAPDLAPVLTGRDIGALYRALRDAGISQRQIAKRTEQSQSEVADIVSGRRRLVDSYGLLVRIAEGLGIPRGLMGLAYCTCNGTYRGGVTVAELDEADLLRRHFERLLALAFVAVAGGQVPGVGELAPDLPVPALPEDVPSRIGTVDLAALRGHRENLRTMARTFGGQARAAVALTDWAEGWLKADATELVRSTLLAELAELHTTTAWCCHDGGAPARALYHFGRAVELATAAGDAYQAASALARAGMMLVDRGRPNDALKAVQLGGVRLRDAPRGDPRVPVLGSWCDVTSAFALSRLDDSPSVRADARKHLNRARDGWAAPDAHAAANMDLATGLTWLHLGKLDTAEAAATVASKTFGTNRRGAVTADLTRAQLHVLSGDPGSLRLAESAIKAVTQTRSGVARQIWLPPLAEALESRRGSDYADLARTARQVATARA